MQILIPVLALQCSTRLATCNFSENELIAKFARVFTSLNYPLCSIQIRFPDCLPHALHLHKAGEYTSTDHCVTVVSARYAFIEGLNLI